ncbi:matrixin family metalloprotease [Candidatus Acetothermia bacterium]|nr:matrixin family metalloprotease [Candidatus Acetothermia bacterium]
MMSRVFVWFVGLLIGVFAATPLAFGNTIALLGTKWCSSQAAVFIQASSGVSAQAVADVQAAINEWTNAIAGLGLSFKGYSFTTDRKTATVIINLKGGTGNVLGSTQFSTAGTCFSAVRVNLSGKAFGQGLSDPAIRTVTRHEFGHVTGLGHSDDPNDLMFATFDAFGGTEKFISACDGQAVKTVYTQNPIPSSFTC